MKASVSVSTTSVRPAAIANQMTEQERALNFSVVAAIISAAIGAVVALVTFPGQDFVPIFGSPGLVNGYAITAVIAGVGVMMYGYRYSDLPHAGPVRAELHRRSRRDWFQRIVAAASTGILLGMGTSIVFYVLSKAFLGAGVQWWLGSLLLAVFGMVMGWVVGGIATGFTDRTLIMMGLIMAFGTILFAAIVTTNQVWWQFSVSNLGTVAGSDMFLNVGVSMAGLIILAYGLTVNRLFVMLHRSGMISTLKLRLLEICYIICGLGILGVGLFPYWYRPNYALYHDISSHSALVAFCLLMFFGSVWAPIYPKLYRNVAIALGFGSIGVVVLLVTGLSLFAAAQVIWFVLWGSFLYINEIFTTAYADTAPAELLQQPSTR